MLPALHGHTVVIFNSQSFIAQPFISPPTISGGGPKILENPVGLGSCLLSGVLDLLIWDPLLLRCSRQLQLEVIAVYGFWPADPLHDRLHAEFKAAAQMDALLSGLVVGWWQLNCFSAASVSAKAAGWLGRAWSSDLLWRRAEQLVPTFVVCFYFHWFILLFVFVFLALFNFECVFLFFIDY